MREAGVSSAEIVDTTIAFGSCSPALTASCSQCRNIVTGFPARSDSLRPPAAYSLRRSLSSRSLTSTNLGDARRLSPGDAVSARWWRDEPPRRGQNAVVWHLPLRSHMAEVQHGLEGVVAFETEIAEPDRE